MTLYIDKESAGNRKRYPGEFTVVLDRRSGEGLGIDATPKKDGTLEVRNISPGSLVGRWNASLAEGAREMVKPGMIIVEVNGSSNSAMELIKACREFSVLHITFRPPRQGD